MKKRLPKRDFKSFFAHLLAESGLTRDELRKNLADITNRKWGWSSIHYYEKGVYSIKCDDLRPLRLASGLPRTRFNWLVTEWFLA